MKKILLATAALALLLGTSCSNDDITIHTSQNVNPVTVNVSLSNFTSAYNDYTDTKHDNYSIYDDYFRTFNSEHEQYIQVRTLFYDSEGNLADSINTFTTNYNAVTNNIRLAEGTYTAITTITFSVDTVPAGSYWDLADKEKLSTVYMSPQTNSNGQKLYIYDVMSYDAQTINVTSDRTTTLSAAPKPIGSVICFVMENFQFLNQADYGTEADNGIRQIALYSQNFASGYRLNPNASEKYIYRDDAGSNMWYYLDRNVPSEFQEDWTYFQNNLRDVFYILTPNPKIYFGFQRDGDDGFTGYGRADYTLENGRTYLAYWDYFQVGNPYFGLADNNHWNDYSSTTGAKANTALMAPFRFND